MYGLVDNWGLPFQLGFDAIDQILGNGFVVDLFLDDVFDAFFNVVIVHRLLTTLDRAVEIVHLLFGSFAVQYEVNDLYTLLIAFGSLY